MKLSDTGISVIRDADFATPGFLSDPQPGMLVFAEDAKLAERIEQDPAIVCVVTRPDLAGLFSGKAGLAVAPDPRLAFFELHNRLVDAGFYWEDFDTAIHSSARIHPRAWIASRNVRIGPDTIVGPGAVIEERVLIGSGVRIGPGTVLGSEGFQVSRFGTRLLDMRHAGGIRVGDGTRILAGAVISPAVFRQFTRIGEDCRIGNLAFLSHNVSIGMRTIVGHGAVINGNVRIGEDAWIGPGATLSHCIEIRERAHISLGATVIRGVAAGERVTGSIAVSHKRMLRHVASLE